MLDPGELDNFPIPIDEIHSISYKIQDIATIYEEWRNKFTLIIETENEQIQLNSGTTYARYLFSNFADLEAEISYEEMNKLERNYT